MTNVEYYGILSATINPTTGAVRVTVKKREIEGLSPEDTATREKLLSSAEALRKFVRQELLDDMSSEGVPYLITYEVLSYDDLAWDAVTEGFRLLYNSQAEAAADFDYESPLGYYGEDLILVEEQEGKIRCKIPIKITLDHSAIYSYLS